MPTSCARQAGLTLVELLVASSLAFLVIAAGTHWTGLLSRVAGGCDTNAQTVTAVAAARRRCHMDVGGDAALDTAAGCTASRVSLVALGPDGAVDHLVYAWDPQRRLMWRSASGAYLLEHVSRCAFSYRDASGEEVDPAALADADGLVRHPVCVTVAVHIEVPAHGVTAASWAIPVTGEWP